MVATPVLNAVITLLCLIGLGLSIYAYVVELQLERNKDYKAMCDISERMSCTKAFKSVYGKGFGLFPKDSFFNKPNSLVGILFYSLTATLAQSNSIFMTRLSYWAIFLSNLASLYFAYILYFKLQDLCVVCVSIYMVNILSIIFTNLKLKRLLAAGADSAIKKKN